MARAQTVNGIEVIEVGGQSDGDFTLYKGHVDINARTYTLKQDGGDWYLRPSLMTCRTTAAMSPAGRWRRCHSAGRWRRCHPPDDGGEVTRRTTVAMSPAGRRRRGHLPDDGGDVTPPDDDGDITRLTAATSRP